MIVKYKKKDKPASDLRNQLENNHHTPMQSMGMLILG